MSACAHLVPTSNSSDGVIELQELRGVVSLFDMLQFFGDVLIFELSAITAAEVKLGFEKDENGILPEALAMVYAKLNVLQALYATYGMKSSSSQCARIIEKIQAKSLKDLRCGELREGLKQLRERSEDEFKSQFFLHLDANQAVQFQNPTKEWSDISGRFYKTRYNIEESEKCFALERYGAAVFHVLQVAEYGVIKLAELLQVEGDKPGWGALRRLSLILEKPYPQRSDLEKKYSKLLGDTVHLAVIVKDNWRHKLDHVDNQIVWVDTDFSPNVAEEIISATRAFMRKLASDLPK
jgi:hypothetical protein